jgi:hypothetical protein
MYLNVLSSCPKNARPHRMNCRSMKFCDQFQKLLPSGNEICVSNIKSLLAYTVGRHDRSCWLDNSTIYEVLSSFAAFLGDRRNFVMNTDASHGLIQHILHSPEDGVCNVKGAYERFRDIAKCTYKNMFSSNDLCVHIAVNEPEQTH